MGGFFWAWWFFFLGGGGGEGVEWRERGRQEEEVGCGDVKFLFVLLWVGFRWGGFTTILERQSTLLFPFLYFDNISLLD